MSARSIKQCTIVMTTSAVRPSDGSLEQAQTFASILDEVIPANSLAKRLLAKIPSLEKVFILWTLAKSGAADALPQIALLRSREQDWSQLARVCDVVSVYLTQGAQPVLDSIRLHGDHVRMEEMCTLAWHVLATPAARDALDQCIANSPDGECRAKCHYALQRWDSES